MLMDSQLLTMQSGNDRAVRNDRALLKSMQNKKISLMSTVARVRSMFGEYFLSAVSANLPVSGVSL